MLAVLGGCGAFYLLHLFQQPGPSTQTTPIVIARGMGSQAIARALVEARIITYDWLFLAGVRLGVGNGPLRAGEFAFPAGISTRGALEYLQSGPTVVRRFTVVEGQTVHQIIAALQAEPALSGEITTRPPEGSLLPETYHYSLGDTRTALIERMQADMRTALATIWAQRQADLPIQTMDEAVILASIIEKETAVASERRLVAGVFTNRLRRGMRLQSDPTTIYGLSNGTGDLGRPLLRRDLTHDSPYNTYVIPALPIRPIANPGREALLAAVTPETTDYLYFVADGTGGHAFAKNLADHNRNVAAWRKIQPN